MRIWDISEPIEPATAPFPGDTPFGQEWPLRQERGSPCNVSTIRMSTHVGTHTDAPLHFDLAGNDIAAADLRAYLGRCRVVDVRGEGDPPRIPAAALTTELLAGAERILLRTRDRHDHRTWDPGFTALGPEAARVLVRAGILLAGIDTPSMDPAADQRLEGHHVLHAGGVAILENLDLTGVPPGDYELIALPLRIVNGDSSPVRAILRDLPPPSPPRP
ncbi:MAG: arylformamidase [Planctomycetes bacterium]|nr:arylformamidase [Planctomycetota bacterium]